MVPTISMRSDLIENIIIPLINAILFLTTVVEDNTSKLDPRINTSPELLAASLSNEAEFIIKPYNRSADNIIKLIKKAIINEFFPSVSVCVLILVIYLNLTLLKGQL